MLEARAAQGADGETEARVSTIIAFRAAREARLGERAWFGLGQYGGPLSQKIHKFVSLVGTHCLLSVYILLNSCPREILPTGALRFPRKVASGSNQGGAPGS